jgi:hypothetical protein
VALALVEEQEPYPDLPGVTMTVFPRGGGWGWCICYTYKGGRPRYSDETFPLLKEAKQDVWVHVLGVTSTERDYPRPI